MLSPTQFPIREYRLTWDGKCEKFNVIFSLTQAQREDSGFQVTGMIKWGKNQNPKIFLGPQTKPQKIAGPKFIPQKIPWQISEP